MQSVMIVVGASIGVGLIVFLTALIDGLQTSLIRQTLGTQAHVVVRPLETVGRPLRRPAPGEVVLADVEAPPQRARSIPNWQLVVSAIERVPGVTAVSPTVAGAALAVRGSASRAVALLGVVPERYARIYPVLTHMVAGRFAPTGTDCVLGRELAADLAVGVGDLLRLSSAEGRVAVFTVRGVFDLGNRDVNRRWVLVSMRTAQTLLDQAGGVSVLDVTVADIFAADAVADRLAATTGLLADPWTRTNAQLLVALRSQSSSSQMIQVFVVLAVAMGLASVLVVSVVQKSREIGILRAYGTSRGCVTRIFLVQGAVVGVVSAVAGSALGAGLARLFAGLARNADGSPTFPVDITAVLLARSAAIAIATGLVAAVVPARRAARLDPADAIRNV